MGYGEAAQEKKVLLVEFNSTTPNIRELIVPCFQELVPIAGSLDDIRKKLEELKTKNSTAWLEIEYTGSDIIINLSEMLDETLAGSGMEIRRIKNRRVMDRIMSRIDQDETLDDLDAEDVFTRCMDAFEVPAEDRKELMFSYMEIIKDLMEEDINAE
jgi:exonuclease SbcD